MNAIAAIMLAVIQSQSDLIGKLVDLLEANGLEPTEEIDAALRELVRKTVQYEAQLDYDMKKMVGTETH